MKSFIQYITEDTDPYDWDTGYGKRFKWVRTPPGAQTPPQTQPTISLVTPANKDAWDWPEVDTEQLAKLKQNWGEIQQSIAPHKRIQIETGQNMGADDLAGELRTRHTAGAEIRGENLPEFKPRPVTGGGVAMRGLNPLGMLGVVVDTFASPANADENAYLPQAPPAQFRSRGAQDARSILTPPEVLHAVQAVEKRRNREWTRKVEQRHKNDK